MFSINKYLTDDEFMTLEMSGGYGTETYDVFLNKLREGHKYGTVALRENLKRFQGRGNCVSTHNENSFNGVITFTIDLCFL